LKNLNQLTRFIFAFLTNSIKVKLRNWIIKFKENNFKY